MAAGHRPTGGRFGTDGPISLSDKGALCIVTSFCTGGDLASAIRGMKAAGKTFAGEVVVVWLMQLASALSYIHSRKILHRDLKTQNVFLNADTGVLRLGDFGLARVLDRSHELATTVTGTPYYMSPEALSNEPYSFKSDMWSLGCVVYELW